jgi:hypothetical protein
MTYPARTQKAMSKRRARPLQQFGQAGDISTDNGALGCTHTVLQYLALLWNGKHYTHDNISRMAGWSYPWPNRGLRPTEVQTFLRAAGLPYVVKYGMTAYQVLQASAKGPVGFGHSYSYWPEWYQYRYAGRTADGSPNGYARPLRLAGRTQLAGFVPPNDAHFGLLLGWDESQSSGSFRVVAWEPNHNSPSRPEEPPYDYMTSAQFRRVYESYQRVLRRTPYAIIPTRYLPV